jgi:lipopolysaccharide/colanic/teichoic acid biosynthesis glycosyltransferase
VAGFIADDEYDCGLAVKTGSLRSVFLMTDYPKLSLDAGSHVINIDRSDVKAIAKRLFDIVGSLTLIIFFLPLMVLVGALVASRVGSKFVFAHEREGRDRKKFACLKFRTMFLDADERLEKIIATDPEAAAEWKASRKLREDPRILPGVGEFLRKSSLDELPQLFNVLIGEMSLVGPRPVVQEEIEEHYGDTAPLYYSVRPGLTGIWQSSGRSDATYEERVSQDADYVQNWTLIGDVMIILKTAVKVANFRKSGAY